MPAPQAFVVGNGAIGFRYKDGVILATDTALSYGKMHLAADYERILYVTDKCAVAFSGDYADMVNAMHTIKERMAEMRSLDMDPPSARAVHGILASYNYYKRNKYKPNLNNFIVAGPNFLGVIDLYGTNFEVDFYASSLARYFCLPLLRAHWKPGLTKEEAHNIVDMCMKVMRRNDCLAEKHYDICHVENGGITVNRHSVVEDFSAAAHRDLAEFI